MDSDRAGQRARTKPPPRDARPRPRDARHGRRAPGVGAGPNRVAASGLSPPAMRSRGNGLAWRDPLDPAAARIPLRDLAFFPAIGDWLVSHAPHKRLIFTVL